MPSKEIQEAIDKIRAAEGDSVTLNLHRAFSEEDDARCLAEGIKEARVPLTLELRYNNIGDEGAKFFSEGIKEARVPLTLDLRENNIGEAGAKFLSEGIKEARVPLTLNLGRNEIGDAGTKFLAEGIKEARVPLTLELRYNNIGDEGAKFFSEGIKEARVPLTLDLRENNIGEAGARFLSEGIKEARVPLTLRLDQNNIGGAGAKFISEGIKEARVPLTLNLGLNVIGEAGAKFISEGIKEARVPLTLDLYTNQIVDAGAKFISEGIKEARFPLTLYLMGNGIGDAGAKFLSEGIKEARVPLTLHLGYNEIGDAGTKFLAEGIKEARFPLTLCLSNSKIGEAGATLLSEGIKEARVPLTLHLRQNSIGDPGAKFISEGIKAARVPLTLHLRQNSIGDPGAKFISEGIKAARVPLTLDLSYNRIGKACAKWLSEGIKEARFPLALNLQNNEIGVAGAKFISEGIKEARVPLTLDLRYNSYIGDSGAKFISEGIKAARIPIKLSCDEAVEVQNNFIIDAGKTPSKFFAKLKFNPFNLLGLRPILIQMPVVQELLGLNYPKDIALIIQDYDPDLDYLAWKAVAAIRAVEGASRDNTYASIDYDLLSAVYSTAPMESVIPALEEKGMEDDGQEAGREGPVVVSVEAAQSLNAKAIVYEKAGDVVRALDFKEQALKMHQEVYNEVHPEVARPLNSIGVLQESLGDAEDYSNYRVSADDVRQALEGQNQERADVFKGQGMLAYTGNSYTEYYNGGIDRVLELRLAGLTTAVALKSQYFGEELGGAVSRLACDVSSILSGGTIQTVLAPVNLYNKHWLGLLFKGFGDRVEVTYMDSEQSTILPGLRSVLENGLSLKGYKSRLEEARLTPQSYNNCGYEVIENFVYYLTGTRATQEGAMYVHSLLVENSLLDPEVYGLKIEENTKLIKFLSNAEPIAINEVTLFAEQGAKTKHDRAAPDNSLAKLTTDLHKASIWFKALDFVVDSARLVQEPSLPALKKLVLDYAYLQAMVSGVNGYSVMISGAETLYQLQLGEYQKAFNVAATTISAMVLPAILVMANRPYLWLAYGTWMAAVNAYGAITNAYSFVLEVRDEDAALRSVMAYKDLAVILAGSPLQSLYDFESKATEYKLQINGLLFDKEKAIVEAQMKKHGEFGQKVFDYIHLQSLAEKYGLMKNVIRGILTEEEAQDLQANNIRVKSKQQSYEHCMGLRSEGTKSSSEYYCYNLLDQVLDHVELTAQGGIVIIEHL